MSRKLIILFVCTFFVFSLVGCSNNSDIEYLEQQVQEENIKTKAILNSYNSNLTQINIFKSNLDLTEITSNDGIEKLKGNVAILNDFISEDSLKSVYLLFLDELEYRDIYEVKSYNLLNEEEMCISVLYLFKSNFGSDITLEMIWKNEKIVDILYY